MKTRIALTLFFTLLFQLSFCQENFIQGYVISMKGDTLHGFIDYRNWELNPNKIFFKEKLSDSSIAYIPIVIRGFHVFEDTYESAIVKTEKNINYLYEIDSDVENIFRTDTTFLQTIIQGEKSLYHYKSSDQREQFYIKNDSTYESLNYKKILNLEQERNSYIEKKQYIGQLYSYLKDCPTIKSKLANTKFTRKNLENLFMSYYKCTQPNLAQANFKHTNTTNKLTAQTGVLAGLSLTSLTFSSKFYPYIVKATYNTSTNFVAGLYLDLIIPRNQGKWSFCNELIYTSFNITGQFEDNTSINYLTFNYSYLKENSQLRFKYPIGNLFIYLNAGFSVGYAINEKTFRKEDSNFHASISDNAIEKLKKFEFGTIFGLGTKLKSYSFEIRYEHGDGISNLRSNILSFTNRFYFLLGYKF